MNYTKNHPAKVRRVQMIEIPDSWHLRRILSRALLFSVVVAVALFNLPASATKGSIIVTSIDLDGWMSESSSSFTGNTLYIGDNVSNKIIRSVFKFNSTSNYDNIETIRNNITSVRLWVYGTGKLGTPLSVIFSNYSMNDTWDSTVTDRIYGSSNRTDLTGTYGFMLNWIWFDVTSQFVNETNNLSTITLEPNAASSNGVSDLYLINSSEAAKDNPYLEIRYDNNDYCDGLYCTDYLNYADISHVTGGYTSSSTWFSHVLLANSQTYFGTVFPVLPTYYLLSLKNSSYIVDYVNNTMPSILSQDEDRNTLYISDTFDSTLTDDYFYPNNSFQAFFDYRTRENKKINAYHNGSFIDGIIAYADSIGPPIKYNNGSPFYFGNGIYLIGSEQFYTIRTGRIGFNGSTYTITSSPLFHYEGIQQTTGTNNVNNELANATYEVWFMFNASNAYAAFWRTQIHGTVAIHGGMVINGNEFISIDEKELGYQVVTRNVTCTTDFCTNPNYVPSRLYYQLINATVYINSSKGYGVFNASSYSHKDEQPLVDVEGIWTYNNGTQVSITGGKGGFAILRPSMYDFIDNITNGWITDERWDSNSKTRLNISVLDKINFSVRGNNINNVSVRMYNTTKIYNSTQVMVSNSFNGLYNNLSVNGNGTYTIKSLNTSLNSSAVINVTVKVYNSTHFNFTATNTTAGQTFNLTVYNDTFPVTNGNSYKISKDDTTIQTSQASNGQVIFTEITVGSDYEITEAPAPMYNLSGYVSNELGAYLQNARVEASTTYQLTNSEGFYTLLIAQGNYTVIARAIGYVNNTNTTSIGVNTTMNFTLLERKVPVKVPSVSSIGVMVTFMLAMYLYRWRSLKQ